MGMVSRDFKLAMIRTLMWMLDCVEISMSIAAIQRPLILMLDVRLGTLIMEVMW